MIFKKFKSAYNVILCISSYINSTIKMFQPEHFQTRSQDLPAAYHDAGQFYFGKTEAWLENIITFSEK